MLLILSRLLILILITMLLPILILFLHLRNPGLQPQFNGYQLQLQYPLYKSFLQENLLNVISLILLGWCSRKFLFLLGLLTIQMLMIYFCHLRLMRMVANFRAHLFHGSVTKFVTKTHLYRYQIISCIAFPAVLANSVILNLAAVPLAVLSLILSIWIIVQTV